MVNKTFFKPTYLHTYLCDSSDSNESSDSSDSSDSNASSESCDQNTFC